MLKTIELVVLPLPLPQTSLFSISSKLPEGGRDTVFREYTFRKILTRDEGENFGENQTEISESRRNLWEESQVPLPKD